MESFNKIITGAAGRILPFFWLRGEDEESLLTELEKIRESGIDEFCIESRPHPEFCREGWWRDVGLLLKKAKEYGMHVWILDDDRFPTGHCNGGIEKTPELSRLFLKERHTDICGFGEVCVNLGVMLKECELIAVLAINKPDWSTQSIGGADCVSDVTDKYDPKTGLLQLKLAGERLRIMAIVTTHEGSARKNYMNLIDSRSVRVLIDEVYETHYAHFKEYFGNTLKGFFSDEPELGNVPGYDFFAVLGRQGMLLSWSSELACALKGVIKPCELPLLWYEGKGSARVRRLYMDALTRLVHDCFSNQVGAWCAAHNVEYIGHILEDAGVHTRTGCSCGHYFREQSGQHIPGIDVVHHQIEPGFDENIHAWVGWENDGEFFTYGLAKLASSCANIYPVHAGRALCELFGNYGWAEGSTDMRYLVNHMLVRGINRFVPHAFSPAAFPDRECPPHFYAKGHNPQFPFFGMLMGYTQRLSALFDGGCPVRDALILYHAQSEWMGSAMPYHKPGRMLSQGALDWDVCPIDALGNQISLSAGRLETHNTVYRTLIIPEVEYLPRAACEFAAAAAKNGVRVIYVNAYPSLDENEERLPGALFSGCAVAPLNELAASVAPESPAVHGNVRVLRYRRDFGCAVMLFNEGLYDEGCSIDLGEGDFSIYDAWNNALAGIDISDGRAEFTLKPGEAIVIVPVKAPVPPRLKSMPLELEFKVSALEYSDGELLGTDISFNAKVGDNLNADLPDFTGVFRMETVLPPIAGAKELEINVNDSAFVYLNGKKLGAITGRGRVPISTDCGELRIDVYNTLYRQLKDPVSVFKAVEATGLKELNVLVKENE